jgi:hypothetical protein
VSCAATGLHATKADKHNKYMVIDSIEASCLLQYGAMEQ